MDFTHALNTIVVSDIHLADAEPPHPHNPLWKKFKRPEYFIDGTFAAFLKHIEITVPGPFELVLNGDIFDFDSVMAMPPKEAGMTTSWLERARGLASEENKSRFKMEIITRDHSVWVQAIGDLVRRGNRVVFILGNHDVELHWPSVQRTLVDAMGLNAELRQQVRFCEWFYISNGDTLIEHGNQYDSYNMCSNPINPLIRRGGRIYVRIPFGNLAGKFMLNGMGLFNPHAESSYIKSSIKDYMSFYYRYILRTQPLLMMTWFWSAMVTMIYSIGEGLLPAMRDPLTIDSRVKDIARRSNAEPHQVWSLRELHAHPAIYNPLKILKELWLDRAIIFALILIVSFQLLTTVNYFVSLSWWWMLIPVAFALPWFIFYAKSVESEVMKLQKRAFHKAPIAARITGVTRVVQGHTHLARHTWVDGVEYLNTGTWSPAFEDVECSRPYGTKCFAWIQPSQAAPGRMAQLLEWKDPITERIIPELKGQVV